MANSEIGMVVTLKRLANLWIPIALANMLVSMNTMSRRESVARRIRVKVVGKNVPKRVPSRPAETVRSRLACHSDSVPL